MSDLKQSKNPVIEAVEFDLPEKQQSQSSFRFTISHFLLLALAAFFILVMAFITLTRSIQIVAVETQLDDPQQQQTIDAKISVKTPFKLPIANRVLVFPGEHQVEVSAAGYKSTESQIEVGSERHQQFELELFRTPGSIDITTTPNVTAAVTIAEREIGKLPGKIDNVPAGVHTVTIDAPLYRNLSKQLTVRGKGLTEQLAVELEPAWANFSIDSQPSQAKVFIDQQVVGKTPLRLKLEEGSHQLEIKADKFKDYSQQINITAQQDIESPIVKLVPADAVVKINSVPSAAAVIVNGEYQGVSPISLALAPNQDQKLQFYKAGYQLSSETLRLNPAQQLEKNIQLKQDSTKVRFSVSPTDAELFVDGKSYGKGAKTLSLNSLPHKVVVKKNGYVSYQKTIIPTKGSTQVVSVKLLTKAQHFWKNVPASYTSSAGHKMKLFKSPGLVKMGSSRREQGRRSNEVQYQARLKKHFYVSLHEVSNKQFRAFKSDHSSGNYRRKSLDSGRQPVANVSWQDAARYCNWLSIKEGLTPFYTTKSGFIAGHNKNANGYRLLTEAEWSWLARERQGSLLRYAWGNAASPTSKIENYADKSAAEFIKFILPDYNDGYKAAAPVGKFKANHNGLYDLGGNVAEWTNDWYSANSDKAGSNKIEVDPLGPEEGEFHVIRGASWARGHLPQLRLAYRDFGAKGKYDVGFRIARYVGEPSN